MDNPLHIQFLVDSFGHLIPEMVLGLMACVLFVGGTFRSGRDLWGMSALGTILLTGLALALTSDLTRPVGDAGRVAWYSGPIIPDSLSLLVRWISLIAGGLLVLLSWHEMLENHCADHHACLLIIVAGVGITAMANDLVILFLGLELISIPTNVLLYLHRRDSAAQEAAMKYFLLSVFSSGLLLFGFSYLYGLAGTTNLPALLHTLSATPTRDLPVLSLLALVFVVAGLGFRITAVPFHFYAPDVYQGTSHTGAALLAFLPKLAGFLALIRVLGYWVPDPAGSTREIGLALSNQVPILFWFLAAITMFLGNLFALQQDNIKRLLAYSGVAHGGYMLITLAMAPYLPHGNTGPDGIGTLLYYLMAYGAMTVGAFALVNYLHTPARPVENVEDLAGLGSSHPGLALLMVVFLFSLIGIPFTAGFTGKFLIFLGTLTVEWPEDTALSFRVLAVIAAINAAIGAWYYLRIVAVMFLRNSFRPPVHQRSWTGLATLWICALLTIGLAIPPGADWILKATRKAGASNPAPHASLPP